jgi:hypothetical protein
MRFIASACPSALLMSSARKAAQERRFSCASSMVIKCSAIFQFKSRKNAQKARKKELIFEFFVPFARCFDSKTQTNTPRTEPGIQS